MSRTVHLKGASACSFIAKLMVDSEGPAALENATGAMREAIEAELQRKADAPEFKFVEFNPRRRLRGAEAARVEVIYSDGESDLLWMSVRDIKANIREFGQQEGLKQALDAYRNGGAP